MNIYIYIYIYIFIYIFFDSSVEWISKKSAQLQFIRGAETNVDHTSEDIRLKLQFCFVWSKDDHTHRAIFFFFRKIV